MTSRKNFDDFIMRDLARDIAHHERLQSKQQSPKPPAPEPTIRFLDQVPDQPLTWLWPGRIPLGHLTLLDGPPGSGLSLMALTLAACISRGSPLPDGTPTQRGYVLLLAPYDSPTGTLKARFQAAGGDPSHLQLVLPLVGDPSHDLAHTRPYAFPQDLTHLAAIIRSLDFCLVIIDPASAIPGLTRCLPALIELARQTNCAILLTRCLRQAPLDPFHAPAPTSPLLQAARSRLLLAPDPADPSQQLLLTTKHSLGTQPPTLAYAIVASQAGIPALHWRGQRDHDQLSRLCTGPLRSPYRQAILRFLEQCDTPQTIPDILKATSYDREAGRKMLVRMQQAGELVSPARGLYTTAQHPCLLHFSSDPPPVPHVSNVPNVSSAPSSQLPPLANSSPNNVPSVPSVPSVPIAPSSQHLPPANSSPNDVPSIPNDSISQNSPPAHSPQSDTPPVSNVSSDSNIPSAPSSQSPPSVTSLQSDDAAVPVTDPTPSTLPFEQPEAGDLPFHRPGGVYRGRGTSQVT